jgi:hypothetical protein
MPIRHHPLTNKSREWHNIQKNMNDIYIS